MKNINKQLINWSLLLFCSTVHSHDFDYSEYFSDILFPPTKHELDTEIIRFQAIEVHNGINKWEALIIGSLYTSTNIEGCSVTELPVDRGEYWLIKPKANYEINDYVKINKKTGLITFRDKSKTTEELINWLIEIRIQKKNELEYNKSPQPTAERGG